MNDRMNFKDAISAAVERKRQIAEFLKFDGKFSLQHFRKGELLGIYDFKNAVTNAGKNAILGIMFAGTTQITTWYMGLIDSSGYTALAAGDTMASHAGWNEFTSYSESTREEWVEAAPSGQAIGTSTVAEFTMSGSGTIKGGFIVSNSTKGGTTGTLWSTGLLAGGDVSVVTSDVLRMSYSLSC